MYISQWPQRKGEKMRGAWKEKCFKDENDDNGNLLVEQKSFKVAHTFYCWYCLNVFFKAIHRINIVKAEIIKRQNKSDHKAADIQTLVIAPCAPMTIISWLSCLPLPYQQFPRLLRAALLDMLFSKLWQVKRWRLKTKTWNAAALCLLLWLVPVWD